MQSPSGTVETTLSVKVSLEEGTIDWFMAFPDPNVPKAYSPQIGISGDATGTQFENPTNRRIPERIRSPFDITFQTGTLVAFPNPGGGAILEVLNAQATVGGKPLPGATAITEFELVGGADPYFTNVDPSQNNVFYLSEDLRLFTATPAINPTPVSGAPAFTDDNISGAFSYIPRRPGVPQRSEQPLHRRCEHSVQLRRHSPARRRARWRLFGHAAYSSPLPLPPDFQQLRVRTAPRDLGR